MDSKDFVMVLRYPNYICFAQMFYEGIPYMNQLQEKNLRQYWKANIGVSNDLDNDHRDALRSYCSVIARWLVQARDGDIFTLEKGSGGYF